MLFHKSQPVAEAPAAVLCVPQDVVKQLLEEVQPAFNLLDALSRLGLENKPRRARAQGPHFQRRPTQHPLRPLLQRDKLVDLAPHRLDMLLHGHGQACGVRQRGDLVVLSVLLVLDYLDQLVRLPLAQARAGLEQVSARDLVLAHLPHRLQDLPGGQLLAPHATAQLVPDRLVVAVGAHLPGIDVDDDRQQHVEHDHEHERHEEHKPHEGGDRVLRGELVVVQAPQKHEEAPLNGPADAGELQDPVAEEEGRGDGEGDQHRDKDHHEMQEVREALQDRVRDQRKPWLGLEGLEEARDEQQIVAAKEEAKEGQVAVQITNVGVEYLQRVHVRPHYIGVSWKIAPFRWPVNGHPKGRLLHGI
mmetsp:Transcript_79301/g.236271  ORF Transcript_79301/g.236271 Transcript_79301/m.236271 type:complete len:360 (+) Transcript_79301:186-1265(+)